MVIIKFWVFPGRIRANLYKKPSEDKQLSIIPTMEVMLTFLQKWHTRKTCLQIPKNVDCTIDLEKMELNRDSVIILRISLKDQEVHILMKQEELKTQKWH